MSASPDWELLLAGYTVSEIAARLKSDVAAVAQSLTGVVKQFVGDIETLRETWFEIGLAQLKRVQVAAWEAWSKSWEPKSRTTRKKVRDAKGEREEETTLTEESRGEVRYLMLYYKSITDQSKWWEKYPAKPKQPAPVAGDPRAELASLLQLAMARKGATP